MSGRIARRLYISGDVQGVGYRFFAQRAAARHQVVGYVKNLDDGRVQLLVEGPEDAVADFLKEVRTHWKGNITKEEIEEQKVTGKYKDFRIAY